jgi:hypothetical protein
MSIGEVERVHYPFPESCVEKKIMMMTRVHTHEGGKWRIMKRKKVLLMRYAHDRFM